MPEFIHVADAADVPDPGKVLIEVEGEMIALFHVGGSFYAIDDVCTHDGGPLVDGELQDYTIACPRHGAKFDIRTGAALSMPAIRPTLAHDVRVENGSVSVRLRETGSGPSGMNTDCSGKLMIETILFFAKLLRCPPKRLCLQTDSDKTKTIKTAIN